MVKTFIMVYRLVCLGSILTDKGVDQSGPEQQFLGFMPYLC